MAINQNHLFDELDGKKCAIVEKNVLPQRVAFLQSLLEYNHYTVVVVPSPPPKAAPAAAAGENIPVPQNLAETFTVGVTDVSFNATNAIFGRLLKTSGGRVVTLAYWQQKEKESNDAIPYFESPKK
jgi:hypothetical protein